MPLIAMVGDSVHPVGSAFVVSPQGLLVTASHVLEHAASLAEPIGAVGNRRPWPAMPRLHG